MAEENNTLYNLGKVQSRRRATFVKFVFASRIRFSKVCNNRDCLSMAWNHGVSTAEHGTDHYSCDYISACTARHPSSGNILW